MIVWKCINLFCLRYLHNNNEINEFDQFNNDNFKSNISCVTLQRQESGFGFRIVGGKEDGSQVKCIILFLIIETK